MHGFCGDLKISVQRLHELCGDLKMPVQRLHGLCGDLKMSVQPLHGLCGDLKIPLHHLYGSLRASVTAAGILPAFRALECLIPYDGERFHFGGGALRI